MVLRLSVLVIFASAVAAQEQPWWVVLSRKDGGSSLVRADGKGVIRRSPQPADRNRMPSPDGEHWVWADLRQNDRDIYICNKQGKRTHRLTTHRAMDSDPTWAPDSKRVAFVSARSGQREIWIKSISGGEARQLTKTLHGASSAKFAPTGNRVAYIVRLPRRGKGWIGNVVIHDVDSGARTLVAQKLSMPSLAWHPDGKRLAVSSIGSIRLFEGDKLLKHVEIVNADKRLYAHLPYHLIWRPDGKELACSITFAGGRAAVAVDNAMGRPEAKFDRIFGDRELFFMTPAGKLRSIELPKGAFVWPVSWAR